MRASGIIFIGLVIMSLSIAHLISFAGGSMFFGVGLTLMGFGRLLWGIDLDENGEIDRATYSKPLCNKRVD